MLLAYDYPDPKMRLPRHLVGEWRGSAHVDTMAPLLATSFPVRVRIYPDGSVSGTIGDARLADAWFLRHRSKGVSRDERHDLMDYMIRGRLLDPVIAAERVSAPEVFIPLDYNHGKFDGAIHAHETQIDGKLLGIFTSEITLTKL